MEHRQNAIGIFDSGIGGTSIWREIQQQLPNEHTLYLSDSKNAPYGQRSVDEILALSIKNTEFLLDQNCKLIVVACNTATTNAIGYLRAHYDVPFIGIEPAIKPASIATKSKVVGILATQGTLNSALFEKTSAQLDADLLIVEQVGEGLVNLIENGAISSPEMTTLLERYLSPMLNANADCIVLGCTHYPYLYPQIAAITGPEVQIIDSGHAVALQTKKVLTANQLLTDASGLAQHHFYTNKNLEVLRTILNDVTVPINIELRDF